MRTQVTIWGVLLALFVGFALIGGDALRPRQAQAEEKRGAAPKGVWVFDVRVVRVDPATKEGAEAPHPIAEMTGSTTTQSWPKMLGALKQRGTTTILMDQNITTMPGEKARGHSDRTVPIMALNFANKNDEQKRASNVKTGCRLDFTPAADRLQYGLHVQWALAAAKTDDPPEQFVAEWNGSYPNLNGETLVLHYREQVTQTKGAARAVEIYGLITGRLLKR